MPYFAAAFARMSDMGWVGRTVDLDEVEAMDDLVDVMREFAEGDEPVLLLLEEDDEWFTIVRIEGVDDPRIFLSDLRAPLSSGLAVLVHDGIQQLMGGEEEDVASAAVEGEPGGDTDLLEDLGVTSDELVELCVEEGLLPDDALSTVAERAGFAEELEKLR
ncbi:MAG: tRNA adenosine deaminase-associated protein [Streptosporangiaceae bacterium]